MKQKKGQPDKKGQFKAVYAVLLIVIAVGIILLLRNNPFWKRAEEPGIQTGIPAPVFSLPRLDGEIVNLADTRGKIVFLTFWATWCHHCRGEMPAMEKLYQELKDDDFSLLAVSVDKSGAEIVAPFVKNQHLSFPVLLDTTGEVNDLYGIKEVPESFIIGKDGMILKKMVGPIDWVAPDLSSTLMKLIENQE